MTFTQCGKYLAVAGSGSREILLFDVQAGAQSTPLIAIAVSGEPKNINVRSVSTEDGEIIEILCVFEDINGCYIRYSIDNNNESNTNTNGKSNDKNSNKKNIQLPSICKITSTSLIMAGSFGKSSGDMNGKYVTLAIGTKVSPFFATVSVEDSDGNILENVTVGVSASILKNMENVLEEGSSGSLIESRIVLEPVILGPNETGGLKRPLLSGLEEVGIPGDNRRRKLGTEVLEVEVRKGGEGGVQGSVEELTLEERLESLSASLYEVEKGSRKNPTSLSYPQPDRNERYSRNDSENLVQGLVQGPSSNSLVVLIDQALQSGDDALLEQSLACDEISVVEATAKRLAPGRVVQLLRRLVAKFEKRPSRGLLITRWLAAVLRFHTSFLISIPDLSAQLAGLSQMLEQRLSSYTRLASLGGRLDLLMSQIDSHIDNNDSKRNGNNGNGESNGSMNPKQIYKEM